MCMCVCTFNWVLEGSHERVVRVKEVQETVSYISTVVVIDIVVIVIRNMLDGNSNSCISRRIVISHSGWWSEWCWCSSSYLWTSNFAVNSWDTKSKWRKHGFPSFFFVSGWFQKKNPDIEKVSFTTSFTHSKKHYDYTLDSKECHESCRSQHHVSQQLFFSYKKKGVCHKIEKKSRIGKIITE